MSVNIIRTLQCFQHHCFTRRLCLLDMYRWSLKVSELGPITRTRESRPMCTSSSDDVVDGKAGKTIDAQDLTKDPVLKEMLQEITKDFEESILKEKNISDESKDTLKDTSEDSKPKKTISNEEVDIMLAQYNIEEFYGVEPTIEQEEQLSREELLPISTTRGVTGVFDISDIVAVLCDEKIEDVCVIKVPEERQYVDYMVIGSGRSTRHLLATAQNLKWIWKKRRLPKDPATVHIEGINSSNWLAMDLGNIAVHLFLRSTRKVYDLESLWTCGTEFDKVDSSEDNYTVQILSDMTLEESKQILIDRINQFNQESGSENDSAHQPERLGPYVDSRDFSDTDDAVRLKYMDVKLQNEDLSMDSKANYHKTPPIK